MSSKVILDVLFCDWIGNQRLVLSGCACAQQAELPWCRIVWGDQMKSVNEGEHTISWKVAQIEPRRGDVRHGWLRSDQTTGPRVW